MAAVAVALLAQTNAEQLAQLECLELGKPIEEARGGVTAALSTYRYYAGWPDKLMGDLPPAGTPGFHTEVRVVPVGVCGAIVPWNYPVLDMAKIIGPCLASGCTLVYKTNEYTPLNVLRCAELLIEAGMPAGVVNFINGGVSTGELISSNMDIDKVFFTGSVRAGKVCAAAAPDPTSHHQMNRSSCSVHVDLADTCSNLWNRVRPSRRQQLPPT
jgi:acyl-CoA reductase-like NAD-dependent aldehyde dehydrogenase